jgi:hypothetical protein
MTGSLSKFLAAVIPVLVFASLTVRPQGLPTQRICLKRASWLLLVRLLLQQAVAMAEHTQFLWEPRSVTQ